MARKLCLYRNSVLSQNRDEAKKNLNTVLDKATDGEIMINRYMDDTTIKVLIGIRTSSTTDGITKNFILDSDATPKDVADSLKGITGDNGTIATSIATLKAELLGTDTDTADKDTIKGVKKAISAEAETARTAEKTNADAIAILNGTEADAGSVAKTVKDAVEALDVAQVGGTGKVITTISETNGKIAATATDLKAENVAFTPTTKVDGAVDVTGATVTAAIASLAKSVKDTQSAAATYKVVKVTEGLDTNVKEAYQLVQTINGAETNIDVQIPIYKDQTLKSVTLENSDGNNNGQFLKYTYITADGEDSVVYVDVSKFLTESEFKNGLNVSAAGEVSVKIDTNSETFLTVGEGGVKLTGVQEAINTAKDGLLGADGDTADKNTIKGVKKAVTTEVTRATAAEDKIEGSVGLAADGSHVKTNGNYTKGATTVVGEISALDTQVKVNSDKIDQEITDRTTAIEDEKTRAEGVESTIKGYTVNGKAISTNPLFTGAGAIKIDNTKKDNTVEVSLKLSDPGNNLLVIDKNGLNVKEVIDCGTYA